MSDKSAPSKKSSKRSRQQPSVLGSLPATRPTRLGRHAAEDGDAAPAATPRRAAASAKAKPRATAAAKPKARSTTAAKSRATSAAKAKPRATTPRATTPPPPPPPRPEPPEPPARTGPPSGPELVTTAVQAMGEIAQIGAGLGVRALRNAVRRLPRP